MLFKDHVSGWGMLVITWVMIVLTLPFFYASWQANKKFMDSLTECEKQCYPYRVDEDKPYRCMCQPEITAR